MNAYGARARIGLGVLMAATMAGIAMAGRTMAQLAPAGLVVADVPGAASGAAPSGLGPILVARVRTGPPAMTGSSGPAEAVAPAIARPSATLSGQGDMLAATNPPKDLNSVIGRLRNILVGLAVSVAGLFATLAGLLRMIAGGDTRAVEMAKSAFTSAVIGLVIAGSALLIVAVLRKVLGL